jgi:hypothetical protein
MQEWIVAEAGAFLTSTATVACAVASRCNGLPLTRENYLNLNNVAFLFGVEVVFIVCGG